MQRQVFISHATDDPDWLPEQVEAVASAIHEAGIIVKLDLWHERDRKRRPSLAEWQTWMEGAIDGATHIVCLVSDRYRNLWEREPGVHAGFGPLFESTRLIHGLYLLKQKNDRRILTLRLDSHSYECIPRDLALDCPDYRWTADREVLLSDLSEAALPIFSQLSNGLVLDGGHESGMMEEHGYVMGVHGGDRADSLERDPAAAEVPEDIVELSAALQVHAISIPGVNAPPIGVIQEEAPTDQRRQIFRSSIGASGLWPAEDEWRAPVGDFPPPWASAWGDDVYGLWSDLTVNGVTQRMRWIEPSGPEGFWMGSTQRERDAIKHQHVREWANKHEHEPKLVPIRQGFWLADTPCTQALWQAVTGNNPSHFSRGRDAPERPVENVSWDDVNDQFFRRFTQTPAWGTHDRLCLPSEDQWEYAARAGMRTAYWWGEDWDDANVNADAKIGETTLVKQYPANPWGLHDIHGNVWEWCIDLWRPRRDAPAARPDEGYSRVVRGGSWLSQPGVARAAYRGRRSTWDAYQYQGFRFALRSPAGPEAR